MDNKQLAAAWASRRPGKYKSGNGTMIVEDGCLYSYGKHYLVGVIVNNLAIINLSKVSHTTGRHCSLARQAAAAAGLRVVGVHNLTSMHRGPGFSAAAADDLQTAIRAANERRSKARSEKVRDELLAEADRLIRDYGIAEKALASAA